jgi:hypothetical protein
MADAPEIKVKLTAEDTGVASAIRSLSDRLKELKKTQDETTSSAEGLKKAFDKIAGIGAAIGIEEFGRKAFNAAVEVGKMSDKTGISTQTLSVFRNVADDAGVSTEAVFKGLQKASVTITQFEQGSAKAGKAFQILNLTQKDFVGLNADQKIRLVAERIGTMEKGMAKATATQQIFGRGNSDLTVALNSLAAQGFDAATESTRKLGLLLDQTTTDDFRAAKASVQELEDAAEGMATQFEAGLLPAVSDVGEALVDSVTQGGVSFKDIGKVAGEVVRGIALVFIGLAQTLGTVAESIFDVFSQVWKEIKNEATTEITGLSQVLHGHFADAEKTLKSGLQNSVNNVKETIDRQKAIYGALADSFKADYNNLFPSAEEEERRRKERIAKLRVKPEDETKANIVTTPPPNDAAARAALALLQKQLEDEVAIHKAVAAQVAAADKTAYDQGLISLQTYYDRRRAEVAKEATEEVAILQRGLDAAKEEAAKAQQERDKTDDPKQRDKQEAARLNALKQVDELQTKITLAQVAAKTKTQALDDEQFKQSEENAQKILAFNKEIEKTENDKRAAAQQEIELETRKLAIVLQQQGLSKDEADAALLRFRQAKERQADFESTQEEGNAALKNLEDQKAAIQDKVTSGKLFQLQADQQIRDLEQSRLPALQSIADQLVREAKLTGDIQKIQAAEDFQKRVHEIGAASNQVGIEVARLRENLQGSLTSGFANLFTNLISGTQSVANSFRQLASNVLSSLSQMAAQMLAQIILTKLLKSALGGFAGGGLVPGGGNSGGGFAEGGLIRGPGGPKADAIPARLSAGEYVIKADSVQKFGVANLEAINRGIEIPSLEHLSLPKFSEGGLVGNVGGGGGDSQIHLGIGLDEGLILKHLSSKAAGNVILQHLSNNPKAAQKALSRSA